MERQHGEVEAAAFGTGNQPPKGAADLTNTHGLGEYASKERPEQGGGQLRGMAATNRIGAGWGSGSGWGERSIVVERIRFNGFVRKSTPQSKLNAYGSYADSYCLQGERCHPLR